MSIVHRRVVWIALLMIGAMIAPTISEAADWRLTALRARAAILDLRLDDAAGVLSKGGDSVEVAIERARLALYRGQCDTAVRVARRTDVAETNEGALLLMVAQGCARATAGAIVVRDDKHGVLVRLQNEDDAALVPLIASTVSKTRDNLEEDLGVRLPSPVIVDLLHDQLSLSAMSGLPEQAAQTTGTVAVAKWGRVMMLSPRASPDGYPWLDTLAHEMVHLALSQATRDRAALWLQEGVAKRQETRWRAPSPFDDRPSADWRAAEGIAQGLDLPLTGLGPSIAMLPTAEQAAVAFAQVTSFVRFFSREAGSDALPRLLEAIRDQPPTAEPSTNVAIEKVTKQSMAKWEARWRSHIDKLSREGNGQTIARPKVAVLREASRRERLGKLLLARGHAEAARSQLGRAHRIHPRRAALRALYARATLQAGETWQATRLVIDPAAVNVSDAHWWSMHDHLDGTLANARAQALAADPLSEAIACEERPADTLPLQTESRALCAAAVARIPLP